MSGAAGRCAPAELAFWDSRVSGNDKLRPRSCGARLSVSSALGGWALTALTSRPPGARARGSPRPEREREEREEREERGRASGGCAALTLTPPLPGLTDGQTGGRRRRESGAASGDAEDERVRLRGRHTRSVF